MVFVVLILGLCILVVRKPSQSAKIATGLLDRVVIRLAEHIRGYNSNKHLQNAILKYNLENFEFGIFCFCEPNLLLELEPHHLDQLFILDKTLCYNISLTAESCLGVVRSEETRKK